MNEQELTLVLVLSIGVALVSGCALIGVIIQTYKDNKIRKKIFKGK